MRVRLLIEVWLFEIKSPFIDKSIPFQNSTRFARNNSFVLKMDVLKDYCDDRVA